MPQGWKPYLEKKLQTAVTMIDDAKMTNATSRPPACLQDVPPFSVSPEPHQPMVLSSLHAHR